MKFSIIVPVYNAEAYLPACVESVLQQRCPDFEMILVDDGSDAPTAALCDALAKDSPQIRVLHQQNAGQLISRLNGVAAAEGEYCLFLDADDLLAGDCLQTLADAIKRYRAPDMIVYSFFYEEPDGERRQADKLFASERIFRKEEKTELYALFFKGSGLNNVWTKAVKRSVFSGAHPDYGPFTALRCAEDRLQSMVMVSGADTVVYLPQPLYIYRRFPGSVTRMYTPEALDRFNSCVLYPFEKACIVRWGLPEKETLLQLQAAYPAQAVYLLDRFYKNMPDAGDRRRLLGCDWRTLVPADCIAAYKTNPYLNDTQKALFSMMLDNDVQGLTKHFKKKKRVDTLRTLKKKVLPR
ncbi:MAG: glycosyltransferase family 2 protein [Clostridia bacterium]|nr:glycosyltransferase family 2 protein [Clostridia bacterium]